MRLQRNGGGGETIFVMVEKGGGCWWVMEVGGVGETERNVIFIL